MEAFEDTRAKSKNVSFAASIQSVLRKITLDIVYPFHLFALKYQNMNY